MPELDIIIFDVASRRGSSYSNVTGRLSFRTSYFHSNKQHSTPPEAATLDSPFPLLQFATHITLQTLYCK